MNYKIEAIPGETVVMVTLYKDYSFAVDDPVATNEVREILNKSGEPMFMLMDVTDLSLSLDDLVKSANSDARGEQAIYHHPNLSELLVVTRSSMVQLAVKGLTTFTFGNVKAKAFRTIDEALAYARTQTGVQASGKVWKTIVARQEVALARQIETLVGKMNERSTDLRPLLSNLGHVRLQVYVVRRYGTEEGIC